MSSDEAAGRTIGWGMLGAGRITRTVGEDVKRTAGSSLVAVGSRDQSRADAAAAELGAVRGHGSYQALVADPEVDVVYVGTTHEAHVAAALLAIEAGKAVVVEKPFATSVAQAAPVIARAAERGTFLMEAVWTRFLPATLRMVELVQDGAIGELLHVHADFGFRAPPTAAGQQPDRLRDPARAGGALLDLGVYPVTFARVFLGAPSTVSAAARVYDGYDATTQLLFSHDSGALATLGCSLDIDYPTSAQVYGTRGTIHVEDFFHPQRFTLLRDGAEPETFWLPHEGSGYVHEVREASRCVRDGLAETPLMTGAETLAVLGTLDEARRQIGVRYPFE